MDTIKQTFILQASQGDSNNNKEVPSSDAESQDEIVPISLAKKSKSREIKDEIIVEETIREEELANPTGVLEKDLEVQFKRYSICLLLGIAYAATLGGIATLIGTG